MSALRRLRQVWWLAVRYDYDARGDEKVPNNLGFYETFIFV